MQPSSSPLPSPRRTLPLRWHLVLLVVGTLLPVVLFAVGMITRLAYEQRSAATRRLLYSARLMAGALDRELSGTVRILNALAESAHLDSGDFRSFYADAQRVQKTQSTWMTILLLSPDGQQLVNTRLPWGARLPRVADPESLRRIIRTGAPTIGNMARGRLLGKWAFPVRVPVKRDGRIRYVLNAVITPSALGELVHQPMPGQVEWTRTVVDSAGVVAARTRNPERFVGKPGTPYFLERIRATAEGVFLNTSIDGNRVYAAFSRDTLSGWTATVTTPQKMIDGPVAQSITIVFGIGLAVLLLSGLGAYALSRRVSHGIVAAAAAAEVLAEGSPPKMATSSVAEVERLRASLARSSELLLLRERQRDELLHSTQQARTEAETANRAKDEFLAMLGHELRNPLSPIINALAILKFKGQAQTREFQVIERQVDHLARLVEDLLDVSRITRGKIELERAPIEIADVIARAAEMVSPLLEQHRHTLTLEVPATGLRVHGDALRLAQVVANLLTNAARYTPPQGQIRLAAQRSGDWIEITVADNGQGIAPDLLPQIFDLFVQGPRTIARKEGGLGLGLALVRNLVALHGGEVSAESPGPGQGSTFHVRLPRV